MPETVAERGGAASAIERDLAARLGRRHAVLTNRGTTALAAALDSLDAAGSLALFPAAMCSIPVFSARFAGWTPVFADVNRADANFDLGDVERVLAEGGGRVRAVIPVHMFGRMDDMAALTRLAARHGASVVEDAALALGAERDGRRAGASGRLACLSFVRKMLPLEMGGAVLTDEEALARRARDFVARLPPEDPADREEGQALLRAFHAVTGCVAAGGWARADLLAPFAAELRRLLLRSTGPEAWEGSVALKEMDLLPDVIQSRRARAETLETVLAGSSARELERGGSSLFARPVAVPFDAEDFLDFCADRGYTFPRIAYPVVAPVFGERRAFPNAEAVEREVIGLPLDHDRPLAETWEWAEDFARCLADYAGGARRPAVRAGRLEMRMGSI